MDKLTTETVMTEFKRTGSVSGAAKAGGIPRSTARSLILRELVKEGGGNKVPGTTTMDSSVEITEDGQMLSSAGETIKTLDALLVAAKIDRAKWKVETWTINKWDSPNGKTLWQVKAHLSLRLEWLQGVGEVKVAQLPRAKRGTRSEDQIVLVMGDSHVGFDWDFKTRQLLPYHDERALQIALSLATTIQPHKIILLGDMLDLASWTTKFIRKPESRYTTQPSLDALHAWLVALRKACRQADIVYIEGNHEVRATKFLIQQADEILGLMSENNQDPLLSVPNLLKLSSLDITYCPKEYWQGGIRFMHGEIVKRGGGATVAALLAKESSDSNVFGHIHRQEYACRTLHKAFKSQSIFSLSPGCLCRTDGIVPGSDEGCDWQQGLCLLTLGGANQGVGLEMIPIENGRGWFRGQLICG